MISVGVINRLLIGAAWALSGSTGRITLRSVPDDPSNCSSESNRCIGFNRNRRFFIANFLLHYKQVNQVPTGLNPYLSQNQSVYYVLKLSFCPVISNLPVPKPVHVLNFTGCARREWPGRASFRHRWQAQKCKARTATSKRKAVSLALRKLAHTKHRLRHVVIIRSTSPNHRKNYLGRRTNHGLDHHGTAKNY